MNGKSFSFCSQVSCSSVQITITRVTGPQNEGMFCLSFVSSSICNVMKFFFPVYTLVSVRRRGTSLLYPKKWKFITLLVHNPVHAQKVSAFFLSEETKRFESKWKRRISSFYLIYGRNFTVRVCVLLCLFVYCGLDCRLWLWFRNSQNPLPSYYELTAWQTNQPTSRLVASWWRVSVVSFIVVVIVIAL